MDDVPGTTDPTSVSIIDDPGLWNGAKNPDAMPLLKKMAPEIVCVDIDGVGLKNIRRSKNPNPFTVVCDDNVCHSTIIRHFFFSKDNRLENVLPIELTLRQKDESQLLSLSLLSFEFALQKLML